MKWTILVQNDCFNKVKVDTG